MTANQRWGVHNPGGGWRETGGDGGHEPYRTLEAAMDAARQELRSGGGELVVQDEAGPMVRKDRIGRPDPRSSRG